MNYDRKKISLIIWIIAIFIVILSFANNNKNNDSNLQITSETREIKNTNLTAVEQVQTSDYVGKVKIENIEKANITSTLFNDKNEISEYAIENKRVNTLNHYATKDPEGEVYVVTLTAVESLKDNIQIKDEFKLVIVQSLFKEHNDEILRTDIEYLGSFLAEPAGYVSLTSYDKGLIPLEVEDSYANQIYKQLSK